MSKLYDVLSAVIDKVNCSIKAEPQTLTDEQKAQARVNIGAEASGTAESFAGLAAASAETAQKNAGFAAASKNQAADFAASASASQTAAADSAAVAANAAGEAKGYRDEAKEMLENGEFDGADGPRGRGFLNVSSSTSSASGTGDNGVAIKYKIALAAVKSEAVVDEVFVGDTVRRTVYLYPVVKVDDNYVYLSAYTSIKGTNGVTPVKGTDYWTETDKTEMVFELIEQSAPVSYAEQTLTNEQKAQARANIGAAEDTVLELVNSIEECVDTSKRYVLPDGYIYAYTYGEHTTENKNHILSSINTDGTPYNGGAGYKKGYRLNSSGVETSVSDNESIVSGFIPYNGQAVELRVPNTQIGYSSNYLHVYDSNFSVIKKDAAGTTIDGSYHNLQQWVNTYGATLVTEASTIKISFPAELLAISGISYIRVSSHVTTTVDSLTFNLALDEELDSSEVVTGYAWTNTGLYYGSADTGNRLSALENKTDDHETRIATLETSNIDSSDAVPSYWEAHLAEKADAIQQAMETAGRHKSAFLWYTDAHWANGSSKVSPVLLKYLYEHTSMNKVNFGGDIIGDSLLSTREQMKYLYEWRAAIKDLPNHHSVEGNHDVFTSDSVDYEGANYTYAFLLAPEEAPNMIMGDGGNYYYIDNPAEKTRYLYLAYLTSNLSAMLAQGQFIVDALNSTPEGWHIVAISHRWWQYSASATPTIGSVPAYLQETLDVFDAYNAREVRSGSDYFYAADFSEGKGKVEFCIGGHIHADYDFTSTKGIPVIITTADANQNRVPDSTVDSGTIGTVTEAAVFGIIADYNDAANTKITVVGVGRGTSRIIGDTGNSGDEPSVTPDESVNLFDKTDADVLDTGRFNSSKAAVAYQEGQLITGYIEAKVGDVFTVTTDKSLLTNGYTGTGMTYDTSKTAIYGFSNAATVWTFSSDGLMGTLTIPETYSDKQFNDVAYIRFCVPYNAIDNIVITRT